MIFTKLSFNDFLLKVSTTWKKRLRRYFLSISKQSLYTDFSLDKNRERAYF